MYDSNWYDFFEKIGKLICAQIINQNGFTIEEYSLYSPYTVSRSDIENRKILKVYLKIFESAYNIMTEKLVFKGQVLPIIVKLYPSFEMTIKALKYLTM